MAVEKKQFKVYNMVSNKPLKCMIGPLKNACNICPGEPYKLYLNHVFNTCVVDINYCSRDELKGTLTQSPPLHTQLPLAFFLNL